jgi:hypothetical protein
MKIGGHPIDLMVELNEEHSIVTQPVGLLSRKHTTIIKATGNWACHPFLMSRCCNLGSHKIRQEFLYLPDCHVGLMGRDLLCKLMAQITFYSNGITALKLRRLKTKTLILMVIKEDEW